VQEEIEVAVTVQRKEEPAVDYDWRLVDCVARDCVARDCVARDCVAAGWDCLAAWSPTDRSPWA